MPWRARRASQCLAVAPLTALAQSCPPLLQQAISVDDAERLAAALRVLADPSRLRLLSLIEAQPQREACVCHLTEPLGLSQPTVSHHLKVLRESGWVRSERRGTFVHYWLRPEAVARFGALAGELSPALGAARGTALPVVQPQA